MSYKILIISFALFAAGCASHIGPNHNISDSNKLSKSQLDVVKLLGSDIGSYRYAGSKNYINGMGYSLKYIDRLNTAKSLDIFIWPIAQKMTHLSAENLVNTSAGEALESVYLMENRGHYKNVNLISSKLVNISKNPSRIYKADYDYDGVANRVSFYTSLDKVNNLKIRISSPKNDSLNDKINDVVALEILSKLVK